MIYNTLANYYDDLVKDEEATQAWVDWIYRFCKPCSTLELACGSGEITHALADLDYSMTALDLSMEMVKRAQEKDHAHKIHFLCQNMLNLKNLKQFDCILCLCDSFNYLLEDQDVERFFQEVHDHLNDDGYFFFDMHSLDRLDEFSEEFNETGCFDDDTQYQWSIMSEDDFVYQDFAFFLNDGKVIQEHHIQRVYDPTWLSKKLSAYFEIVDVCTDFELDGIDEGEKYFYVLRKKGKE